MFLEFRVQVLCVSMLQFFFLFFFSYPKVQTVTVRGGGGGGGGGLHSREVWVEVRSVEDKNPLFR